jgi:hydroxypyruvate isomerase
MPESNTSRVNRRQLLQTAAGAAAVTATSLAATHSLAEDKPAGKAATKGNINQSIVHWCFSKHWDVERTSQIAKQLGCKSIELIGPKDWPTLKKYGLTNALVPSHLFVQGMNNPRYQDACLATLRKSIDNAADAGYKTVITFTGFGEESGPWADGGIPNFKKLGDKKRKAIDADEGLKNCVAGFKKIVGYAEKKKIDLSLEMLNTRADDHPMKGHPGYQGDSIDYCMEIINQVGSPRLGLLFDLYHVQIMDGDLIRRIGQCKEVINHVHTAGNPGRGELDAKQEINYAPCMQALVDIGYKGYVGQEFIPTRDPLVGLREAVALCDV